MKGYSGNLADRIYESSSSTSVCCCWWVMTHFEKYSSVFGLFILAWTIFNFSKQILFNKKLWIKHHNWSMHKKINKKIGIIPYFERGQPLIPKIIEKYLKNYIHSLIHYSFIYSKCNPRHSSMLYMNGFAASVPKFASTVK
jgi:hypothetical protein